MKPILFRCSSVGRLMTEPTATAAKAGEILSVGAKTYVRELVAQELFGVDFEVSSKQMEKGTECEDQGIALFNHVFGRSLKKNDKRRSDDFLSGESDLPGDHDVTDIKLAWSLATFPLCVEDIASTQRWLYEYQLRAYMRLWNKPLARLAYCMVNTPERLIGFEPIVLHVVDHIPPEHRVTIWEIERDLAIEARMVEKMMAARLYAAEVIAEFDRTHRLRAGVQPPAPPWEDATTKAGAPVALGAIPEAAF